MIVQPDFLDHWKTRLLVELLEDDCAPLYVIRFWAHCQNRKTHRFSMGCFNMIRAVCHAPHESEKFKQALIDSGFIRIEGQEIVAHDWDVVNASLIANWENGKRGGRPAKKTHGYPMANPSQTHREPIREEKRRGEKKKRASKSEIADILDPIPESRRKLIDTWLKYKAERNERYKPTGLKSFIKKWSTVSNADFEKMIEKSMASNYSGVFELRPEEKEPERKLRKTQSV